MCLDNQTVLRAGWWTTDVDGSPAMIGEYQDLDSSPFWEVDHLSTDGVRSNDFSSPERTTRPRRPAGITRARDSGPTSSTIGSSTRWPPIRSTNFPQAVADPANPGSYLPVPGDFIAEDLNVGEDYAIRVQQLKAKFQGDLTDKIRWRLNVWGLRKSGERQVTGAGRLLRPPADRGRRAAVPRPQPSATDRLADDGTRTGRGRQVGRGHRFLLAADALVQPERPAADAAVQLVSARFTKAKACRPSWAAKRIPTAPSTPMPSCRRT